MDKLKEKKAKIQTGGVHYTAQYYEHGPKKGPVFMFLHGYQTDVFVQYSRLLEPVMSQFKQFRYIFAMNPGHAGTSNRPASVRGCGDAVIVRDFLVAFLLKLKIREVDFVMGHSLGANSALDISLVDQIKVNNIIACQPQLPFDVGMLFPKIIIHPLQNIVDFVPPLYIYKSLILDLKILSRTNYPRVQRMHSSHELKLYDYLSIRDLLKTFISVISFSIMDIKSNTLLIRAGTDKLTPQLTGMSYPDNVQVEVIPGVYHEIHNEKKHLACKQTKLISKFIKTHR